jgi:hypothetical protein
MSDDVQKLLIRAVCVLGALYIGAQEFDGEWFTYGFIMAIIFLTGTKTRLAIHDFFKKVDTK